MSTSLGQHIRRAREREGPTQTALAEKIGVAPGSVSVWEAGGGLTEDNSKKVETILGPLFPKKAETLDAVPETQISSFGVWLRDNRSAASISVPALAKASGVSIPAINDIESGKILNPPASTRNKLAKALKQSVPEQVVQDTEQEQAMIKFLKSNAVINKQSKERFA